MKYISAKWIIFLPLLLSSCTYLKYTSIQAEYARIQEASPSQINLKHMIDRDTFFVVGQTTDRSKKYTNEPMIIAAFSNQFIKNEKVDTMYLNGSGTHFGLNLPPGQYQIVVLADLNRDGILSNDEVIGAKSVILNHQNNPQKIASQVTIELTMMNQRLEFKPFPMPADSHKSTSLFFPTGTIRELDDPVFADHVATLGMYDPASFMELSPTAFFALEEDQIHKIPVIFVHGIDDSPRSFAPIINRLDRDRYKPWFFYYPSGGGFESAREVIS